MVDLTVEANSPNILFTMMLACLRYIHVGNHKLGNNKLYVHNT